MAENKAGRRSAKQADGEAEVLASIAEMSEDDRAIAGRLFTLIKTVAPELSPRMWYAMPAGPRTAKSSAWLRHEDPERQQSRPRVRGLRHEDASRRRQLRQDPARSHRPRDSDG